MTLRRLIGCAMAVLAVTFQAALVQAALTPEQKKQIAEVKKELQTVAPLITKGDDAAARKILDTSETKLRDIAKASGIGENDKLISTSLKFITTKRGVLDKKQGIDSSTSFSKSVAPILVAKCMNCHNEDRASGGLNLSTFAGMKAGGSTGPLLEIGSAAKSLLVSRLNATGNNRMPRGQAALSSADIATISAWINQGAKFDGANETASINARPVDPKAPAPMPTPIVKATGEETVSFTKDVAPFMVNLCVRCHSGNNPRGGLSLNTFEDLMKGGQSGRVILPGDWEGSLLWKLVGKQDPIKMPPGQALITRTNWNNLQTWLKEGAKFDGNNPKATLESLVPTETDLAAAALAKMSAEEFKDYRLNRSHDQWKRSNSKETPRYVENNDFIVYGNVSEDRLKEIAGWADEHAKTLKSSFSVREDPIWKGRLTIFVFKDRFGFEEFPRVIERAEIPRETAGFARASASGEEAYICLEDVGDESKAEAPGLRINLIDHLTGAYLKRSSGQVPDWVVRGAGLALAARQNKKDPYFVNLAAAAQQSVKGLAQPTDIFANGTFSTADIGPVGYTLVEHMIASGGVPSFSRFVGQLQSGTDLAAALRGVYSADMNNLALSYLDSLGGAGAGKKPGKKK